MAGAIVQSQYAVDDSGGSSTTISATLTGVTAGNTLVAHTGWDDGTASTASASDGTAYPTADAKRTNIDNLGGQVFYLENAGAGSHTVTITLTNSRPFRRLRFVELSGLQPSASLDQATGQGQTTPGTGANAVSSGATAATTNAADFVMGFSQNTTENDPGTGTISAGTGYTISGTNRILALESKSVSATGAQTATFTQSNNVSTITHVVAFKEFAAPIINTQPTGQFKNYGDMATFSVSATASAGSLSYQWQDNSSGAFANISGATASSLTVFAASGAMDQRRYRVIVTDSNGSTTSNEAVLGVRMQALTVAHEDWPGKSRGRLRALSDVRDWWPGPGLATSQWFNRDLDFPATGPAAPAVTPKAAGGAVAVVSITGVGSLLPSGMAAAVARATVTAPGPLVPSSIAAAVARVTLTGVGSLTPSGRGTGVARTDMTGVGTLTPSALGAAAGRVTISAPAGSDLVPLAAGGSVASVVLTGVGSLVVQSAAASVAHVALSGVGTLTPQGAGVASALASVTAPPVGGVTPLAFGAAVGLVELSSTFSPVVPTGMADPRQRFHEPFDLGYFRWKYGHKQRRRQDVDEQELERQLAAAETSARDAEADARQVAQYLELLERYVASERAAAAQAERLERLEQNVTAAREALTLTRDRQRRLKNQRAAIAAVLKLYF